MRRHIECSAPPGARTYCKRWHARAAALYPRLRLLRIRFVAGRTSYYQRITFEVGLSRRLFERSGRGNKLATLLHEFAHALAPRAAAHHGREFFFVMFELWYKLGISRGIMEDMLESEQHYMRRARAYWRDYHITRNNGGEPDGSRYNIIVQGATDDQLAQGGGR